MVIYGAVRLRGRGHVAAGILYGALFLVFFVGVQFTDPDTPSILDAVTIPAWLISWLGGTVHAAILQRAVRARSRERQPPVDPILAATRERLAKREQARSLVASNSTLATELMIGVPISAVATTTVGCSTSTTCRPPPSPWSWGCRRTSSTR